MYINKRFSYDNIIQSRSIEPNDLIRTYKLDRCCDFMEEKFNNPRLTQKQICKQLGFSDSTIKRYRDDIKMDSPHRRNNHKKKKPKRSTEDISKNENTNESSKNEIIDKRIKYKPKVEIRGGYLEDRRLSGKELIEQAFNTTIND